MEHDPAAENAAQESAHQENSDRKPCTKPEDLASSATLRTRRAIDSQNPLRAGFAFLAVICTVAIPQVNAQDIITKNLDAEFLYLEQTSQDQLQLAMACIDSSLYAKSK